MRGNKLLILAKKPPVSTQDLSLESCTLAATINILLKIQRNNTHLIITNNRVSTLILYQGEWSCNHYRGRRDEILWILYFSVFRG